MWTTTRLVVGIAAAGAFTLTGCDKPAPSISAWSGTESVNSEALCWAFDSDNLTPGQCAEDIVAGRSLRGVPTLEVGSGNTLGISVDPEVAETGWRLLVAGNPVVSEPITKTYYRLQLGQVSQEGAAIQVVAGQDGNRKGVWTILLKPAS